MLICYKKQKESGTCLYFKHRPTAFSQLNYSSLLTFLDYRGLWGIKIKAAWLQRLLWVSIRSTWFYFNELDAKGYRFEHQKRWSHWLQMHFYLFISKSNQLQAICPLYMGSRVLLGLLQNLLPFAEPAQPSSELDAPLLAAQGWERMSGWDLLWVSDGCCKHRSLQVLVNCTRHLDVGRGCSMLSRRRAKTNHDLAASFGFTTSKGIKAKPPKDLWGARHL